MRAIEFLVTATLRVQRLFGKTKAKELPDPLLFNVPKCIDKSVQELQKSLTTGEFTSVQLVRSYLDQIVRIKKITNAVVGERRSDALLDAEAADSKLNTAISIEEREELFRQQPLLGIPFTVKESCAVKGMPYTVGSLLRANVVCDADSEPIRLLREAGGIPLAVTATAEYCTSIETHTLQWGQCRNPHDLTRTPGGSSGGEAALNAAKGAPFGIGSDLAGSIRIPALFTGIYGHKATGGLISVERHFPSSATPAFANLLQFGPLTRFASNLRLVTAIMAGKNQKRLQLDVRCGVRNMRIFYAYGFSGLNRWLHPPLEPHIEQIMRMMINYLRCQGHHVQPFDSGLFRNSLEISLASITKLTDLQYVQGAQRPTMWDTLKKLIRTPEKPTAGYWHTKSALNAELSRLANSFMRRSTAAKYHAEAEAVREKLDVLLGNDGILIFPTFDTTALPHNDSLNAIWSIDYTMLFNALGLPAMHIPKWHPDCHLPVGFSVIAGPYKDRLCFEFAEYCEQSDKDFRLFCQKPII